MSKYATCTDCGVLVDPKGTPHDCPGSPGDRLDDVVEDLGTLRDRVVRLEERLDGRRGEEAEPRSPKGMDFAMSVFGPKCPGGDACENLVFLKEYEAVDREYERHLVRELASARLRINELEALVTKLKDPEEKRHDGQVVRKDRWEMAIRTIASRLYGPSQSWEVADIVERVAPRKEEP